MRQAVLLGIALVFGSLAYGQKNKSGLPLMIARASDKVVLDGVLNESTWQKAAIAKNFYMNFPVDSLPPTFQSEARLAYDEHFFYVSFVCYDDSKPNIMQSLRRDFEWELNDNIGIYLDSYNDYTNGFYFQVTPFGVQSEGIMSGGGQDDDAYNSSWDNKWYSEVKRSADKWIAELAIPLKSFRYNHNATEW
ncbi:MAG: carbohydrate binding family 9 domain-containing protein, partial [Cytophagales bacterium]